jgi:hypothetical protein
LEGVLCPEELERDNRAVWVVLMAYGCGFGLRAGSGVLGELRGGEDTEVRTVVALMEENSKLRYFECVSPDTSHWDRLSCQCQQMGGFCHRNGSDWTVGPRDKVERWSRKDLRKS